MKRRFLTADDVRRARGEGASEIALDEATVVTPQALEAAQSLGVALRTARGAYEEPPPDRGPDAEQAARTLPHLPEPEDDPALASAAVVTAVGKNRAGVLSEITSAIATRKGNVHDVSQKVVGDYFHLILAVEFPEGVHFGELKGCLECLGGPEDYAVRVMHERVFRFMHRV
jgi:ACT domain-containing protein